MLASIQTIKRTLRTGPLLLILALPAIPASALSRTVAHLRATPAEDREHPLWKTRIRDSQFSDVPRIIVRPRCEDVQPPQALTTPEPVLNPLRDRVQPKVSFIIGTDGRVHSPLILESAGPSGDRRILQTVRSWRYRPATCNGVPTETEGKIEFSSR
jgi:hypothetical protein